MRVSHIFYLLPLSAEKMSRSYIADFLIYIRYAKNYMNNIWNYAEVHV